MICQHYWPEHFQITEICEELVTRGHEVTALVGIPNYPTGTVPEEYLNGKNRDQMVNGVHIIRCEEIPRGSGLLGLVKNYASYPHYAKKTLGRIEGNFDVVFAYQLSPVLMAAPAVLAKKRFHAPLALYCCDIWPDAVMAMLPCRLGFLMPFIKAVSSKIYRSCDALATNSSAYIDCMEQVHGIDRRLCTYMPQYAEDTYLNMDLNANPSSKVRFMVMGNIGKLQHMEDALEAVNKIKHRNDFELHVVGTGSAISYCEAFVKDNHLEQHVVFHGRHPFEEMPRFYRMADACVLTLNVPGAPWISSTLPSRLQGYMAAGKPILASVDGSAAEVIHESGCGKSVPAGDSAGLAGLLEGFIDNRQAYLDCGNAGRKYFRKHFMKDRYMDGMESFLTKCAKESNGYQYL